MLRYNLALRQACERRLRGEPGPRHTKLRSITLEEMQAAEGEVIKVVQRQSSPIEIAAIQKKESSVARGNVMRREIKPSSSIYKLDPML